MVTWCIKVIKLKTFPYFQKNEEMEYLALKSVEKETENMKKKNAAISTRKSVVNRECQITGCTRVYIHRSESE